MQLRAGKYGEDYIFIMYAETNRFGHNGFGDVAKGTKPKVFVLSIPSMNKIINDQLYDNLIINTNEDLRTFRDGVLIWGGADQEGNLVIHKIGTPKLTDNDEEINDIITKEDIEKMRKVENNKGDEGGKEVNCSKSVFRILSLVISQIFLALEFILS